MRKITENAVNAFVLRKSFSSGNTTVCKEENTVSFILHRNKIASLTGNQLTVSSYGWETPTTKERLNGILKAFNLPHIVQKDFTWYFSDGKLFKNNTTFTI